MSARTGVVELMEWDGDRLDLGWGVAAQVIRVSWWPKRYGVRIFGNVYYSHKTKDEAQDSAECILRQILTHTSTRLSMMEAITPMSEQEEYCTTLAQIEYEYFLREAANA